MLFNRFSDHLKHPMPLVLIFTLLLNACGGSSDRSIKTDNLGKPGSTETKAESNSDGIDKPSINTQKNKPKKELSVFNWEKLSGWHTQGVISRDSPVRIDFNRDVIDESLVGKDASDIMHISPAIKGNPVFASKSSIIWTPPEHLTPGTSYKVSVKLAELNDVPSSVAPFQYTFQVIPLDYEIKTLGLTSDTDISNGLMLEGQLLVSDRVAAPQVEKVISASFQGKKLPIEWTHDSNGRRHDFIIKGIIKETFDADLRLSWDGSAIDIKTKGTKNIPIPSANKFEVTHVAVINQADTSPFVEVRFSDELDPNQNIKGLVELAKIKRYKVSINNNRINIYPNKNLQGSFLVKLHSGIKAKDGNKVLSKKIEKKVSFDDTKPQVKFVSKGAILPENSTLEIPFEAVGVNAVEVTAFRIYSDNMKQFLQVSDLSGSTELGRTGRHLWRKVIPLKPADPNKWNRYTFNATELMKKYAGGMVRLTLSVKRQHSTYRCPENTPAANSHEIPLKNMEDYAVSENSGWDGISDYIESDSNSNYDYDWNNRNDPCNDAYYHYKTEKTTAEQNFIASNIGLIAKREANGDLHIISTDIRTAKPLTGTEFEVRNYQGQLLGKATSDGDGFAKIELKKTPFLLIAKKFKDTAYLKLNTKTALAISHFDIGGKKIKKGIKGFIYGERGVWRPGDDIFLTFVLQNQLLNDKTTQQIPDSHPVTMKLIDPKGRVVDSKTSTHSVGGFYAFKFKTAEEDQTGHWMVKAFVGGSTFSKSLMIETVRPNRLKIELNFVDNHSDTPTEVIYSDEGTPTGTLFSQWLHGATASKLKADVSVKFSQKKVQFGKFTDYTFDDPARSLKSQDTMLLEGRLDEAGYLKFSKDFQVEGKPAGMLKAKFTSRVFEGDGVYSISRSQLDYHPYANYVGIKLPKGDATRGMLLTDKKHTVNIASLSARGEAVSLNKVQVSLYKIKWKWWWDKSSESLAEYADSRHKQLLKKDIVSTTNGMGEWSFDVKYPDWGRYLIRACDLEGTHCTGKTVYIDWPGWAGRAQQEGSGAASRLNLFSDKKAYSVGDIAKIQLPSASQGRALLSIETGSKILDQRWITFDKAATVETAGINSSEKRLQFEVPITAAMAPNAYVYITLLQPHEGKANDRPIRLYGIIPLDVKNPKSYLLPKIQTATEWQPESKQTISVSEENGRRMNYTLAIVDEGLLGLTSFKTPNLHRYFYSKEALGIKTWDLFDYVVGAYGGKLERMLALGGGDGEEVNDDDSKKRRFPPVVKFLGPFTLAKGETSQHEIELPPYLGAVRVMVVAGEKGAYGNTQQSIKVRQPLMLQSSLPRVLGPQEEVSIPITLFAMDEKIKTVTVSVKTDDLMAVVGEPTQQINFTKTGEKITFINVKTANKAGKARLQFSAIAGEYKSEKEVYLDIRRANQETVRTTVQVIEPGKTWNNKATAFGLKGTNQSILELSTVPPLNIEKRLNYLIKYPHGCLEQVSSSAFPQLFLSKVVDLTEKQKQNIQHHVQKAIDKLQRFQTGTGDFSYWPGGNHQNPWASIYAGHFLLEAKKLGYHLPANLLNNWLSFQIDAAQGYIVASNQYSHTQAYRLYVLALAGQPQLGAMNRLREAANTSTKNNPLNSKARWLLASAYQAASQAEAAAELVQGMDFLTSETSRFSESDNTFSSTLGDLGLQLDSLVALNKKQDANQLLEKIAKEMGSDTFQSTQGIAWALIGVSHYLGGDTSGFTANLLQDGTPLSINSKKPVSSTLLSKADANLSIENTSAVKLFANLVTKGVPLAGNEISQEKGLNINAVFSVRDSDNKKQWNPLASDHSWTVTQGSDTKLSVSIMNKENYDAENIALTLPIAAGMEILSASEQSTTNDQYDYRDLRDDRVYYYFSLNKGEVKTFEVVANASYKGRYYQPAITVEAMYDGNLKAIEKGRFITINHD